MKKKVLILSGHPYFGTGGVEKYARKIIPILKNNNFDINELTLFNSKRNEKLNNINVETQAIFKKNIKYPFSSIFVLIIAKLKIHRILKNNSFDLIICNSWIWPMVKQKKSIVISIQHNSSKIIFNPLKIFVKKMLCILPSYFFANIIINYTENDKLFFESKIKNKEYQVIPLSFDQNLNNTKLKNGKITFIGRICKQKRLDLISSISSFTNEKIRVIGDGDRKTIEKIKHFVEYKGFLPEDKINKLIYKDTSALIITSDYEGLSYVCVNALSHGIPLIIRDTFPSASFLIDNGNNGILLDSKLSAYQIADILNKTDFSKFDTEKIKNFAQKNFSGEKFGHSWDILLKKIIKN